MTKKWTYAKLKAAWIEALKSGKYKQGKYNLKGDDENDSYYCCLGVLCDVVNPDGWVKHSGLSYYSHSFNGELKVGIPSDGVSKLVQLNDKKLSKLISMNDMKKKNFIKIASYIKRYL